MDLIADKVASLIHKELNAIEIVPLLKHGG